MIIIYKTTNLVNGKIYIGQHTIKNKGGNDEWYIGSGTLFWKAVEKYGKENFKRKVICRVYEQSVANELEEFFIKKYDSTNLEKGYNILSGSPCENNPLKNPEIAQKVAKSNTGRVRSEEFKIKVSKSVSLLMTEERRKEISKQHKGKKLSLETRKRISRATKGLNNPMYGKRGRKSPMFGRKWINNGIDCKFVNIENGLPQGYSLGRL